VDLAGIASGLVEDSHHTGLVVGRIEVDRSFAVDIEAVDFASSIVVRPWGKVVEQSFRKLIVRIVEKSCGLSVG
jgi:hypothetical protein